MNNSSGLLSFFSSLSSFPISVCPSVSSDCPLVLSVRKLSPFLSPVVCPSLVLSRPLISPLLLGIRKLKSFFKFTSFCFNLFWHLKEKSCVSVCKYNFHSSLVDSRSSTPKSDSEITNQNKDNPEMLWTWGELPQAAQVYTSHNTDIRKGFTAISLSSTSFILAWPRWGEAEGVVRT